MDPHSLRAELDSPSAWPELGLADWRDTLDTLHMWTQIVGKIRRTLTPRINHWWNVALYLSARGLTTSAIPYGARVFELEFDFLHHNLMIRVSDGNEKAVPFFPRSVADFYSELMAALHSLDIDVAIRARPDEVPDPIPFDEDYVHASYDPKPVERFFRAVTSASNVLQEFRANFVGKSSPVHFFWGSFDLAVSRFSGRRAPEKPEADFITREGYSHEVSSVGFWMGGPGMEEPIFYAYHAPEPAGFSKASVQPAEAYWHPQFKEFVLPYEKLRSSSAPRKDLLAFAQTTYEAGATAAGWDRTELERKPEVKAPRREAAEHRMEPTVH